ncbi:MAG TPA: trypsin-like peptidase domain-containing protein [Verrucomicrobiae bacterium]|nr:trypsin-like peptidase domain-containing protein [Verrucomicrobiae bacterium]
MKLSNVRGVFANRACQGPLAAFCLALAMFPFLPRANESDARRDATVEAVERVMPSVVNIATETIINVRDPFDEFLRHFFDPYHRRQAPNSQFSLGSGVIIDEEGYVLTNDHVVRRADKIWVKMQTSETPYEAKLVASNPKRDVALLKLQPRNGEKFTAVKFAKDDDLLLGETVLALGNPFGLGGSVSRGILSSKSRLAPKDNSPLDIPNWLQTDASINPGNSGGPLVNLRGELIGLNVAILSDAQGIGFAIPIKLVSEALSEIFTPESSGKALWFGARVKVSAPPLTVTTVQPDSPADKAGLKPGDVIAEVDGKKPRGFIDFNELLTGAQKPDISLAIRRDGEVRKLSVQLMPEKAFFNADLIEQMLGVRLEEVTPESAEALGVNATDGFIISAVDRSAPAAKNLQPGYRYLVTAIDGQSPANLTEAAKILYGRKKGEKVQLGVVALRRRGNLAMYQQGTVEVPIR